MDNRDTKSKQWAQLLEQVEKIRFAMLTTENEGGHLHSRPMTTLDASEDGSLWFFIGRSTHVSREMENHPRVNLSYVAADQDTYLSIAGEARLVEDPFKVKELWEPSMKPWFPGGIADPDLALLRVDVTEAEYWDAESKKMKSLVRLAKAMAGHPESEQDPGHGTLRPGRDV
jgi:general stress protein 26